MARSSADEHRPASWCGNARLRAVLSCAALLALIASAHREVRATALGMSRLAATRLHNWRSYEASFSTPDTGRDALPEGVIAAVDMLTVNNAATFRMSRAFSDDAFLAQRMSEGAWPLAIDPGAAFVVRKATELAACRPVSETAGVALDRCD